MGATPALINSVIVGSTAAIALRMVAGEPLGVAAVMGGAVGLLSLVVMLVGAGRLQRKRTGDAESIFPSPET